VTIVIDGTVKNPMPGHARSRLPIASRGISRKLPALEVHFTPEREAKLAQIANSAGTDAERLVKQAPVRLLEEDAGVRAAGREGVTQADEGNFIEEADSDARPERMLRT
jgi:hypothetical protein